MRAHPTIARLKTLFRIEDGQLVCLTLRPRMPIGAIAGYMRGDGYLRCCVDGGEYAVHRIICAMRDGRWPDAAVDHIDGNILNNRPENLRSVTLSQNQLNRLGSRTSRTGIKNVTFRAGGWHVTLRVNGSPRYIGAFPSLEEAGAAAIAARAKYHGAHALEASRSTSLPSPGAAHAEPPP